MDIHRRSMKGLMLFLKASENLIAEGYEKGNVFGELRQTYRDVFGKFPVKKEDK